MFKSVFSKYLVAFVAIILLCFSLLLFTSYSILIRYVADARVEGAQSVAHAVADTLSGHFDPSLEENRRVIGDVVALATAGNDPLTVLVSDRTGRVVFAKSNYETHSFLETLPGALMDTLERQGELEDLSAYADLFGGDRPLFAATLFGLRGEINGAVIVSIPATQWVGMINALVRTVITSSLWIMLAALIAIYFISGRVSAPLRDIRRAIKEFSNGNFEHRVVVRGKDELAELGIAFNQMAQSLENLEKLRGGFMASVSHELRTPMTTIAGFVDAMRDGVIPQDKQDHYLEIVSTEVHRLSRLVSSLLDVSRIQAGERKFVKKPFDICEMGRQILISFEQKIEEKELQIEFVCDKENMFVLADHDAVYQVLYNICENAVKFSSQGGLLRVSICRQPESKHKLLISVYNQGQGIAAEDLPFVFERFYKGDKSRGLDRKSVGLGLYICKTIVRAHGEDIWATSAQGKDCQFSFTLTEQEPPRD